MQQKPQRITWTNRLTYILTVAGATVGFGATWRFPYMVSTNGGGAYVLVFLLAMFAVGVPIILAENVIGRRAGCDAFSAFARAKDGHAPHPAWRIVGAASLAGAFLIMAFYMVLGAWVIAYIFDILRGLLGAGGMDLSREISSAAAAQMYEASVQNSPWAISAATVVFVLINYFILRRGLIDGIERSVKFLMPLLFLSLLALIARNLTLPGSFEGVKFYLMPDFSKLSARLFLDVLGQVFFALSLGFGVMITLSSHLSRSENMPKTSLITGALNSLIAVLAGFMIFPALSALDPHFSEHLTQGPTLVFVTLPAVFSHMHFGALFAVVFFALLLIAALTTTLPIYQVIISALTERWGMSQQRAICLTLGLIFALGNLPSIFSPRAFAAFDFLSGNIFFTLTALGCVLFVGFSLGKNRALSEISNGGKLRSGWLNVWFFYVRWVLPVVILAIFLSGLLL